MTNAISSVRRQYTSRVRSATVLNFPIVCYASLTFLQNNEAEALRSWRSALDQIYYHNAYRVPPNYQPKSETEKALQDSLRDMEMQCKERVDLLEALKNSRAEIKENVDKDRNSHALRKSTSTSKTTSGSTDRTSNGWLGQGTIPPIDYPDLSRPTPPLPQRPAFPQQKGSEVHTLRPGGIGAQVDLSRVPPPYSPPNISEPPKDTSRTPSPDKRNRLRTTLRPTKDGKKSSKSREPVGRKTEPPVASKAAGLAWDSISRSSGQRLGQNLANKNGSSATVNSIARDSTGDRSGYRRESASTPVDQSSAVRSRSFVRPRSPPDLLSTDNHSRPNSYHERSVEAFPKVVSAASTPHSQHFENLISLDPGPPSPPKYEMAETSVPHKNNKPLPTRPKISSDFPSYRSEYPTPSAASKASAQAATAAKPVRQSEAPTSTPLTRQRSPQRKPRKPIPPPPVSRRPVANSASPRVDRTSKVSTGPTTSSDSDDNTGTSTPETASLESAQWEERVAYVKKHLPKGVDENAAKQIFNEIVVHGDEVHWEDVAGLEPAKTALKEAVVYPFLRPDLFMGLREPARGMLLFGPPGTGKTMLARAVATESRSTFFAISASSLTSKWLGESEKLVRALFSLAKALAPSIIFVDEIDSLLSSRGGSSEHESTRRIKTEFLIQWSDLQRAAAGKEQTEKEKKEGDASRVLVLAATNLPWAIDEAARRRFVRRQYIPLPEGHVRATQLRTLLGHQKHSLNEQDIAVLVELTEGLLPSSLVRFKLAWKVLISFAGFSGSDITALAKDAAMGPLRSLGEALLHMSMDEIRPIQFEDFEASLVNIRPSVSKAGLKEFEDWAREFGERGG